MFLVGKVGIGNLVPGAIEFIDMLHEGEFDSGSVESPITAVGNQELRTRGGEVVKAP